MEYEAKSGSQSGTKLEHITPYVDVLAKYRDDIRKNAKVRFPSISFNNSKDFKAVFKISDEVRDKILPPLGIRLEDKGSKGSIWKYEEDAEKLM